MPRHSGNVPELRLQPRTCTGIGRSRYRHPGNQKPQQGRRGFVVSTVLPGAATPHCGRNTENHLLHGVDNFPSKPPSRQSFVTLSRHSGNVPEAAI